MFSRRQLLIGTSVVGGTVVVATAVPFIDSMEPSERAKAEGAPVTVDIGTLREGDMITVAWRGRPVWLLRRDAAMLAAITRAANLVADPDSARSEQPAACRNRYRSLKPDLAVIIGVCTHLGCTPQLKSAALGASDETLGPNWPGGYFCPCHGSKFDYAGRVFKNVPAPRNLDIPEYAYVSDTMVRIGNENS